MSMNYDDRERETSVTDAEGVMFASRPIWERNRKKRGLGRKVASPAPASRPDEPRSFASEPRPAAPVHETALPLDQPVSSPRPSAEAGLVAPIGRPATRVERAPRSQSPGVAAAIAAGVVAVGAMGAGAWYLSNQDDGVPELAPGSMTTEVATAPILPPAVDQSVPAAIEPPLAETAPPPVQPVQTAARRETPAPVARARPAAAAPDASAAGVNASATLPTGPQPYASLNPDAASTPGPVNPPVLAIPPSTQAEPAPAETPAPVPVTPPVTAEPGPAADPTSLETTPPTS